MARRFDAATSEPKSDNSPGVVVVCCKNVHGTVWCGVQLPHVMWGCVGLGFAMAWVDEVEVGHRLNK